MITIIFTSTIVNNSVISHELIIDYDWPTIMIKINKMIHMKYPMKTIFT